MKSWKQIPEDPFVRKYIDCYWFIEKHSDDIRIERPQLNPDPAGHLILCTNSQPYGYRLGEIEFTRTGTHLILPNSETIIIDHYNPFSILGIKFHLGALYSLRFENNFPLTNFITHQLNPISNFIDLAQTEELLRKSGEANLQLFKKLDKLLLKWSYFLGQFSGSVKMYCDYIHAAILALIVLKYTSSCVHFFLKLMVFIK